MPNYIQNRLELVGTSEQVKEVLKRFSTHYKKTPSTSYDCNLIFENKSTKEYGWFNKKTKEFTTRDKPPTYKIPKGFEQKFDNAWTRFPDFNKIIPRPKELDISSDTFVSPMENSKFGGQTKLREHLDSIRQYISKCPNPDARKETIDNFIAGVKNYLKHGHSTWYSWSIENWGVKWNCSECKKIDKSLFEFTTAWSGVPELIKKMSGEFPGVKFVYEFSDEDTGSNCGAGTFYGGEAFFKMLDNQSIEAYELAFKLRPDRAENYKLVNGKYKYIEESE